MENERGREKNLHNAKVGKRGEEEALDYLQQQGLELRERNWRSGHFEVDLIMESVDALHIVEVKSLTAASGERSAFDRVDMKKQRNLVNAARRYISWKHITKEVQFDVVAVTFSDGSATAGDSKAEIEYLPRAFFPIYA
jgi:Predicted endonuclease distantly related to archaeal Holliday junction resolvase